MALSMPFSIQVNGEPRQIQPGKTVADLLIELSIKDERVAVEVNLDVVRREQRSQRLLHAGDKVEIVSFVGGGR